MNNIVPVDEEYVFEGRVSISQTDLDGVITFVNRQFCNISGYKSDELVGKPHNIVSHPDMPKAKFDQMWKTIRSGQAWNGLIKNIRKDGMYYWAETEVLPIRDEDDNITGYISVGKPASRGSIQEAQQQYSNMAEES